MNKIYLFLSFVLLAFFNSFAQVSAQSVMLVCGTSITAPGTHCDNSPINISGTALNGNSGYFDLVSGSGTLDDHGDKTATYYPIIGEGSITIGFNNNQDDGCTPGQVYAEVTINLISVPETPSVITGSTLVCPWSNPLNYSVVNDLNASSYSWTFPSGTIINSGTGNNAVSVNFGTVAGTVSVTASNSCGVSAPSTLNVDVQGMPINPGSISGPPRLCASNITAATYSITPLPNQIYSWTIPSGAIIVGGGSFNDNYITLDLTNVSTGTLTVNSGNSCTSTPSPSSYSINTAIPVPEICMVTVDDSSKNNIIYWDKTSLQMADTFIVYRDVANNNYMPIGKVPYDSLSLFIDTVRSLYAANGDPNVTSWRYKIAMKDTCGGISNMSPYHQTMFIQNVAGNFSWNDYEVEGQPIPVPFMSGYECERDDNATNSWAVIQTLSASSTAYTDLNYLTFAATADWRTSTVWTISCDPTLRIGGKNNIETVVVKSKSNIKNNRSVGIKTDIKNATTKIKVYPNPASDLLNVEVSLPNDKEATITVENMLGQVVYTILTNKPINSINTSNLINGVYFVKVAADNTINSSKLIIQK